jgi:hypothetical protein
MMNNAMYLVLVVIQLAALAVLAAGARSSAHIRCRRHLRGNRWLEGGRPCRRVWQGRLRLGLQGCGGRDSSGRLGHAAEYRAAQSVCLAFGRTSDVRGQVGDLRGRRLRLRPAALGLGSSNSAGSSHICRRSGRSSRLAHCRYSTKGGASSVTSTELTLARVDMPSARRAATPPWPCPTRSAQLPFTRRGPAGLPWGARGKPRDVHLPTQGSSGVPRFRGHQTAGQARRVSAVRSYELASLRSYLGPLLLPARVHGNVPEA